MTVSPNSAQQLRALAWYGLGVVAVYYFVVSLVLRWQPGKGVRVAKYEPPENISPALAAYLLERGVGDKPLVVAILNLAAKGYLRIEQGQSDYLMSRTNASVPLEAEEEEIAKRLFAGSRPSVLLSNLFNLGRIARDVRVCLESSAEPDLISPHFAWLVPGLTVSLWCLLAALCPEMDDLLRSPAGKLAVLPAFVAVWALLATIRTLPTVFYKLKSRLPGRSPRPLRFVKDDRTAFLLLLVALASLGLIAWATSSVFAAQFGLFVTANLLASLALRAPTAAGHDLLNQLADFRLFFAAVDSDRMNRMNAPTAPSAVPEKYWAWALALDVEHAWGEQFAAAVLNRLGPESAMASIESNCPEEARASAEILDLHLH